MPSQPARRRPAAAVHSRPREQASPRITPVAWVPDKEMDLTEWTAIGQRLGALGRCGQWGLGDWIRYGNAKFGERYARAARITGYDAQTLMNMVYVASRFEISRRRENLSWSHHEALASLQHDGQDYWLDRAAAERLSVSDLRVELRGARRAPKSDAEEKDDVAMTRVGGGALTCPKCGTQVPVSQDVRVASLSSADNP